MIQPIGKTLCLIAVALVTSIVVTSFKDGETVRDIAEQTRAKLVLLHGSEPTAAKVKKCEIILSEEGFLRHRKTYINGKQEYYSLNLSRVSTINYLGTINDGQLSIRTLEDDVIVQTYNDRSGNVDSMSVQLDLHLHSAEPEDLQVLQQNMFAIKKMLSSN